MDLKNKKVYPRVIGRIRYLYPEKKYGVVDTNMFGIDSPGLFEEHPLQFYYDLDGVLTAGMWVTCSVVNNLEKIVEDEREKEIEKEFARDVLPFNVEEDFSLAMQYRGMFSTISVPKTAFELVSRELYFKENLYCSYLFDVKNQILDIVMKNERGLQVIFDYMIENINATSISPQEREELLSLFHKEEIIDVLCNPNGHGLIVSNGNKCPMVVAIMAGFIMDEYLSSKSKEKVNERIVLREFNLCVSKLSAESRMYLVCHIVKRMEEKYNVVKSFLDRIDKTVMSDLFRGAEKELSPELRAYLRGRRIYGDSIFYNEKMIEFWNKVIVSSLSDDYCYREPALLDKFYSKEVGAYVASSEQASDDLRFVMFCKSGSIKCLATLPDAYFMISAGKHSDYILRQFISRIWDVPKNISDDVFRAFGAKRILPISQNILPFRFLSQQNQCEGIGCSYNPLDVFDILPKDMALTISVNISIIAESKRTEVTGPYGGYWTWGEGMKHEKYDTDTYLDRTFSYVTHVNIFQRKQLGELTEERINQLKAWIIDDMEKQYDSGIHLGENSLTSAPMLIRVKLLYYPFSEEKNKENLDEVFSVDSQSVTIHTLHEEEED